MITRNYLGLLAICMAAFALCINPSFAAEDVNLGTSQETALVAIAESEAILESMKTNGLPHAYAEDLLREAKRAFEQAKYAEIARNDSLPEARRSEARNILRLVDWENIYYDSVLQYTQEVVARNEKALYINDKITFEKIIASESEISLDAIGILESAETEFRADRLAEAEALLSDFKGATEEDMARASILSGIAKSSKNLFQRYWKYLLAATTLLIALGYGTYKLLERRILMKKYQKMKAEAESLLSLMKKAQRDRYKDNKISKQAFEIKTSKYEERMQQIKREIPVIESKLKQK